MSETPRLIPTVIIESMNNGITNPIHIRANDDREYILKTRYNQYFRKLDHSIGVEFICYKIAYALKIGIPQPNLAIININDEFIEEAKRLNSHGVIDDMSFDNISKSKGNNLGIEYLDNCDNAQNIQNDVFIRNLIQLDNLVLNSDRSEWNSNILVDNENKRKYYAIDFGQGLHNTKLIEDVCNGDYVYNCNEYATCNFLAKDADYLFYNKLVKTRVAKAYDVTEQDIDIIFNDMPQDWVEIHNCKDEIIDTILSRIGNNKIFSSKSNE